MSLCDQGQSGPFAFGQSVSASARSELSAIDPKSPRVPGAQAVAELVDRPQVDARGVEREAVAVVEAGVLAEAVQEDDGGPRLGGCPVPVVGAAASDGR